MKSMKFGQVTSLARNRPPFPREWASRKIPGHREKEPVAIGRETAGIALRSPSRIMGWGGEGGWLRFLHPRTFSRGMPGTVCTSSWGLVVVPVMGGEVRAMWHFLAVLLAVVDGKKPP